MKFVCDRCQTRYSIADDKVRQKILRIRCKTCGNVILVQESSAAVEEGPGGADPHPQRAASSAPKLAPAATGKVASGLKSGPAGPVKSASEPRLPLPPGKVASGPKAPPLPPGKSPSGLKPPPAPLAKAGPSDSQKARMTLPPPPPPSAPSDPLGGHVEWYVAVGGAQSGPFSRAEAAKRILAIDPSKAVHVWKEGMVGWKPAGEVSVIAQELNLLRPAPPPPPVEAQQGHTPPPVAHPVSVKPVSAPHQGKTAEASKLPAPHAPPASEISDFQTDVDTSVDAFLEATTQKNKRPVEAAAPVFTDVTTKKGKNLRDLESDPLLASSAVQVAERKVDSKPGTKSGTKTEGRHDGKADAKTPAPVQAFSAIAAKRTGAAPVAANLLDAATLPNPPSFLPPGLASGPSVIFDAEPAPTSAADPPADSVASVDGFSEVVAAMAATAPAKPPAATVPSAEFVPLITAPSTSPPSEISVPHGRVAQLFQSRSGLKYIVAAAVLIGLVIVLVVVSLRGDGAKARESVKAPEPTAPPAPEPAKADDDPVANPANDEHTVVARPSSRHAGAAAPKTKTVGPGPVERPVAAKPSSKPAHLDNARPNPFADNGKTVSQDQISAVVRNKNNQAALKSCYERALKMDNHLTSGRMDVTVSIAASGIVQRVVVNAPASFIMVEPCIKLAVRRWTFPPNSEEYATNFPLILQGGM